MKKIVWLIAAMIFFSVLTGCQRGRSEQEEKTYRVAAILPANNKIRATDFWQQVWNGIHDGADTFQIALSEYSSDDSHGIEERFEMALLAQGDGMILFTSDDANEKLLADIRMAREQGKKIVVIDTDIGEAYYDAFVGIDNEKAGYQLGTYLAEHRKEGEKILAINVQASGAVEKRKQAFLKAVKEAGMETAVSMVSLEEDSEERLMGIWRALNSAEEARWLVSFDPSCTIQAAEILLRMELAEEISLIGFGESESAEEYLENQTIRALLVQDNYNMGKLAVEKMRGLLEGKELEEKQYYVDFMLLAREESESGG